MLDWTHWLYLGGAWVEITQWVRQLEPVTVTRGRTTESSDPQPSTCTLVLENRQKGAANRFDPDNPIGPYYGLLGRNTPLRVDLDGATRFQGNVPVWAPQWNEDRSNCWLEVEAAGTLRRLEQGRGAIRVPYRTYLSTRTSPEVYGYWPLEDGPESGVLKPDVGEVPATLVSLKAPNQSYRQGKLAEWLPNTLAMNVGDRLDIPADITGPFYRGWDVSFVASSTDGNQFLMVVVDCVVDSWVFTLDWATSDWTLYLPDGSIESGAGGLFGATFKDTGPFLVQFGGRYDGADLNWHMGLAALFPNFYGVVIGTITGRVLQPIRNIYIYSGAGTAGEANGPVAIGHLAVSERMAGPASSELIVSWSRARGLLAERMLTRFQRVCDEQGVAHGGSVTATATQPMGRQYVGTFLEQLGELERTDGGLIVEARDASRVDYLALADLVDQTPAFVLDYAQGHVAPPLRPVTDDRYTRNDLTVKRVDGGEYRAVRLTGPMSIQDPEDGGVGRYDDDYELNPSTDTRLAVMGDWQLAKGTLRTARFESVTVNLMASTVDSTLRAAVLSADVGSAIRLVNMQDADRYEPVDLLVIGYEEECTPFTHMITFWGVPYELYRRGAVGTDFRLDSDDTTTNEVLDTTETAMDITTPGAPWSAADQPFDVLVGGERMTVTAVAGAGPTQTMTVARSVNGVVKEHLVGVGVSLADPIYVGVV
jgi:hypothetical protein